MWQLCPGRPLRCTGAKDRVSASMTKIKINCHDLVMIVHVPSQWIRVATWQDRRKMSVARVLQAMLL